MAEFRERKGLGLKKISSDETESEKKNSGSFPSRLLTYLLVPVLIVGSYFIYDFYVKDSISSFWDRNAEFLQTEYPEVDVLATLSELEARKKEAHPDSVPKPEPVVPPPEPVRELPLEDIELSVARQFRAREFVIAAVSREIHMSSDTDYNIKKMPATDSGIIHYGLLNIPNFGLSQLVMVTGPKKTSLYVDLNHNLDMTDDGGPLVANSNAFAVILSLPMYQATGVMGLDGEYRLWIYRPEDSGSLRYYPLTQLVGTVTLGDEEFDTLIAETSQIDGNFLNDGVYFDWNRDGSFDQKEHVNPGQIVRLENGRYRFQLQQ